MQPLSSYSGLARKDADLVVGGETDAQHTAFVGGSERAVGYWGGYEIDRRAVLDELHGATEGSYYGDRCYIGGLDAAANILSHAHSTTLGGGETEGWKSYISEASSHLGEAIQKLELAASQPEWWEVYGEISLPTPVSFAETVKDKPGHSAGYTLEQLKSLLSTAKEVAGNALLKDAQITQSFRESQVRAEASLKEAQTLRVPLQHSEYVETTDRKAVRELEEKARMYVAATEVATARVSEYTEKVAAALENALVRT